MTKSSKESQQEYRDWQLRNETVAIPLIVTDDSGIVTDGMRPSDTARFELYNWLRVFRKWELSARPHKHWVLAKTAASGKIHLLWQAKWRRASSGNGFQRV